MSTKTVAITGGAGFIGSHLCRYFLEHDFQVIALDNLISGCRENIAVYQGHRRFVFLQQDVSCELTLPRPVDYLLHFASPASPIDYLRYPLETLAVGSEGTRRVLEAAQRMNARILLASTSEIYGDPQVHPQPESYWGNVNSIGPRSVYDEAKRFAEALTMAYHRHRGVNSGIVRIFNTYGPRMRLDDGRAVPTFIKQALAGEPLTIFGDGSQTRSFCYVDDLVEGIARLLFSAEHQPVNLGNDREFTIAELAREVLALTASRSPLQQRPLPEDDPKVRRPDLTRARALLQWEPRVPLREGLTQTIDFFRRSPG